MTINACQCGCGVLLPAPKRNGQRPRFINGHQNRNRHPLASRFWSRVSKADGDGCWEWTGRRSPAGYGMLKLPGARVSTSATRAAWVITFGSIQNDLHVCHKCDNPPCVRPEHLFLGTAKENHRDCLSKGRRNSPKGEQHWNTKLTADQAREIFQRAQAGGESRRSIARAFSVAPATVRRIANGMTWKDATSKVAMEDANA